MELKEEVERYFEEVAPKGVASDGGIADGLRSSYGVGASPDDVREAAEELIDEGVIHVVKEGEEERTYEYHR